MNGHASKPSKAYEEVPEDPKEKVKFWLQLTKDDEGHLVAGDYMSALLPSLKVLEANTSLPHPSVTFTYTVLPDHCNRLQNLHGGAAATLFDFCTTMAVAVVSRPGFWLFLGVTRSLNVTYMRPARCGEEVLIENHIVQIGKSLTTLRGAMRRKSDNQLLSICEHLKFNIDPGPSL